MRIHVDSEIGPLRRVLVHEPGREIDNMSPSMMERLLFDDILDGDEARHEHQRFVDVLRCAGAQVLDGRDLLAQALDRPEARERLLVELVEEYGAPASAVRRLEDLGGAELAAALIEGLPAELPGRDFFELQPVPNYFFQRDPQVVVGSRVVISSMATDAREREALLARIVFEHHPQLAAAGDGLFEIDDPAEGGSRRAKRFAYAALEGGDVLVASPEVVLVGVSERTNRSGVEELAEILRREETSFRHLLAVELPPRRSFMHLDTVFTFIDHRTCLAYLPLIEPGGPESARVYHVDLTARELSFGVRGSLHRALGELGLEVDLVPCGGAADPLHQQREQWSDGANAFAVAPGVILLYRRNRRTLDELSRRGYRIVEEDEVLRGDAPLLGCGPTVVSITGHELSRARGGPRCMTMPLEREPLDARPARPATEPQP
jgi:arginine deiminase